MPVKRCSKCRTERPLQEFRRYSKSSDGLFSWCKPCCRQADRDRRPHRVERDRAYQLLRKFGITVAEYDSMLESQGGVCAICGKPEDRVVKGILNRLAVDHDHITGRVRGLLCAKCNTALGKFGDDPALLLRAVAYLAD